MLRRSLKSFPAAPPPPPATFLETAVSLALGAGASFIFEKLKPIGFVDAFVLSTALGVVFSSAFAHSRLAGGPGLFLRGLPRERLKEAAFLLVVGAGALFSNFAHSHLIGVSRLLGWGAMLLGLATIKAVWCRGTRWFDGPRPLRLIALSAPASSQLLIELFWRDAIQGSGAFLALLSSVIFWTALFAWKSQGPEEESPVLALPAPVILPFETRDAVPQTLEASPAGAGTEVLVESGAFRVDAAKAVEKLSRFQLLDAAAFAVPWLRAAVASGARTVKARRDGGLLELRFDGTPLPAMVLREPYAGLLGSEEAPAARQLAVGLLALMRLAPAEVEIVSGHGEERRRLRAPVGGSAGDPEPGTETILRVRWAGVSPGRFPVAALEHLRAAYGMTETRLLIDGVQVPDPSRGVKPLAEWRDGTAHGAAQALRMFSGSFLRFYKLGALVEETAVDLGMPVLCFAADDDFGLSLSQDQVVDSPARKAALKQTLGMKKSVSILWVGGTGKVRVPITAAGLLWVGWVAAAVIAFMRL